VPHSLTKSLAGVDVNMHTELALGDVKTPESEVAKKTYAFAKEKLLERTFSHHIRV
jgi:cyanamide hydratase